MKAVVLSGGTDGERQVSLKSGSFVADTLSTMGIKYDTFILPDQIDAFYGSHKEYDIAFPMFHGAYGEDGTVFGLLQALEIPHTHSRTGVHALCFDKHKTNTLVEKLGLNVSKNFLIPEGGKFDEIRIKKELDGKTLFVKPNTGGSSIGAYKVSDPTKLNEYIQKSQQQAPGKTLVEEFIAGEEYSIGIIGKAGSLTTVPMMKVELDGAEFFDFEVKYNDIGGKESFPDNIDVDLHEKIVSSAKRVYEYFDCDTLARVDFIVSNGVPYFLEINTVPGFTEVSIIPRAWRKLGKSNEELIQKMIDLTL